MIKSSKRAKTHNFISTKAIVFTIRKQLDLEAEERTKINAELNEKIGNVTVDDFDLKEAMIQCLDANKVPPLKLTGSTGWIYTTLKRHNIVKKRMM